VVEFVIEPEVTVIGDQGLLKIMLDNLIGNAWKYTSKHETARIEFGRMIGKQGLTFFIKDDGVGFNMAYSDKLFGAFQRLHSADEFSGTGVGLATVRRIVHRHGGEVWAESNPKVSTTFYFTLEQQEREQTDEQPKENYSLSGGQSRRR
jgi:light-regulated signal transduction histidine kinase (bacteriophytochrome)